MAALQCEADGMSERYLASLADCLDAGVGLHDPSTLLAHVDTPAAEARAEKPSALAFEQGGSSPSGSPEGDGGDSCVRASASVVAAHVGGEGCDRPAPAAASCTSDLLPPAFDDAGERVAPAAADASARLAPAAADAIGSGGCTARALAKLNVWHDARRAAAALDRVIPEYSSKIRREDYRVTEHVGIPGEQLAVVANRWHWQCVDLAEVDLRTLLERGSFVIEGILNQQYERDGSFVPNCPWVKTTPRINDAGIASRYARRDPRGRVRPSCLLPASGRAQRGQYDARVHV